MPKIINTKWQSQKKYPTGCESVSTVICLNYLGINITVDEFIKNHLESGEIIKKDNQLYAPSPFDKFVGSPYDDDFSFGCYEPVIEKAVNKLIKEKNLNYEVKNLNNVPIKEIISNYIDKDIPVIFWATMYMKETIFNKSWIIPETGENFDWRGREHCLLLVGYDDEKDGYYFNDPLVDQELILYNKDLVEKRHQEQFSNALAIIKK